MTVWIEAPFDSLPTEGHRKQRYWLMAEAFVRAGHRVVYWTSDFSHARKDRRRTEAEAGGGFELKFVPTKPYAKNLSWARVRSHRAYAREWERQARDSSAPDLVIVSCPPLSAAATGLKLARQFGAKLVVDVQDAWPETFYRLLPRGLRWLVWLALTPLRRTARRLYREADLVTGVCDRYRGLTGRADYFRAYLGRERLTGKGDGRGRRFAANGLRLVYVGNLGKTYDLKTVVEGVKLLRKRGVDVTLDVAGFGDKDLDSAARFFPSTCVRFHGMLGEEDLQELLAVSDIGVIPMREDSFVGVPNKLGEYAAADLRIVSSLAGETAAILEKYGCGAGYAPGDAVGFADAVQKAMNCRGGRVLAEQELDAEKIYADYVARLA